MKCADPTLCYTDGKKRLYRSFSMASPIFKLAAQAKFNCGKCIHCRKKRGRQIAMQCVLEASLYEQNCFITLTNDETRPGYHNNFDYTEIQKFKKRYRNLFRVAYTDIATRKRKHRYTRKIRIFNVHEYGKNGKKHWHLVVFNHTFDDLQQHGKYKTSPILSKLWPFGFNTVGDVNEASAMYQAQYMQKDFQYGHDGTLKKSHSKHSGIGRDYFLKHYEQILRLGYVPFGGKKIPMPRYFERLAHKHYCYFYNPSAFLDLPERNRLYTKFKLDPKESSSFPNRHMADLYRSYYNERQRKIEELSLEWELEVQKYAFSEEKPDFVLSAENRLYDLKNKQNNKPF